jgi:sugar phosphate isomerase/epimerase
MGEGLYNHPAMMAALKKIRFDGFISVEDFRPCPAEEKYGNAIRYLRSIE